MLLVLIPHLGGLTIPVIIYAVTISIMLYMAYLLSFYWPKPASIYLLTGAISFILSDSILAFDKFLPANTCFRTFNNDYLFICTMGFGEELYRVK